MKLKKMARRFEQYNNHSIIVTELYFNQKYQADIQTGDGKHVKKLKALSEKMVVKISKAYIDNRIKKLNIQSNEV